MHMQADFRNSPYMHPVMNGNPGALATSMFDKRVWYSGAAAPNNDAYASECSGEPSPYSEAIASSMPGGSSFHLHRGRLEDAKAMFI